MNRIQRVAWRVLAKVFNLNGVQREQTNKHVLQSCRLYATLSQINKTIICVHDRDTLFQDICTVAVDYGQFHMAWIGLVDDTNQHLPPIAFAGNEQGYLTNLKITIPDEERGKEPTGQAVREGRCIFCQDISTDPRMLPWRDEALKRGFRASASVPFRQNAEVVGVFNVYAVEPMVFDEKELQLIDEIGQNISFALDLIERENQKKLALETLQKSEEHFRQTLDNMLEGCQIIGYDWCYLYVNDAITKHGRQTKGELLGRTTMEVYPGIENTNVFSVISRCMNERTSERMVNEFTYPDGSNAWFELSIQPVPEGVFILSYDITERKKAEEEIRNLNTNLEQKIKERTAQLAEINESHLDEIEERKQMEEALQVKTNELENFFSVASDLLCIVDTSDNFIKVNKAWEHILGYSTPELEHRQFLEFVHPEDMQSTLDAMSQLSEQHPILNFTNRYKASDGSYRFIEWHSVLVGNLIYAAARDITDRKKAEDEIKEARMEAEQANIAKGEFLSRMSHELRTPLNSILGFAQLLEMGVLDSGQKKGVSHILHSGKHLLDLINEVLDISRIEAGRLSLSPEPVQLNGIILEITDIVRPLAAGQQISIELVNSSNNQLFVKSDRHRLKQVLLNLINNAIKYNKVGGSVVIKTEIMPQNKTGIVPIRISITDTGLGISPGDIPNLFKPFERIGAERTSIEGTGLGLAVVKKLMDAMGGCIGVESVLGEGSTFWIELPYTESQLESLKKSGDLTDLDSSLIGKTGTILYVEDNVSNIELVEQILSTQRSGIRLITRMNGRDAINFATEYVPDLILLDLNLPDMHGGEVLKLLQANDKTKAVPVVVISADAMPQQLEKLLKAGAKNYLTKPLVVIEFLKVVNKYID